MAHHSAAMRRVLGAAVVGVTMAAAFPCEAQAPAGTDARAAQAYLTGRWTGANSCGKRVDVALQVDKVDLQGAVVVLHGTAKSESKIDAVVNGKYDPANGLLALDATVVPDDPNFCPGPKVLGKCITLTGTFISPEKLRQKHLEERAALTAASTFSIDVARVDSGSALSGTVRGAAFDCPSFQLVRADQAAASALALQSLATEQAALTRIDANTAKKAPTDVQARMTWLQAMGKRGDPIAMAEIGHQYEVGAASQAPDFAQAAAWYLKAAQAGEARAQRRLADLYAKGQGVAVNMSESERWGNAAKATAAEVGRYCVAPAMLRAYMELFDSVKKDPSNVMVGFFTTMLTGISLEEGSFNIEGAGVEEVTLRDGPFVCRIAGRRVGASATNITPNFAYAGEDGYGHALYYDNRGEVAMNEAIASFATTMASKSQTTQAFQVSSLGANKFRVTLVQAVFTTGHTHATDVTIDPATLVSTEQAAAQVLPTAPVSPPSTVPPLVPVNSVARPATAGAQGEPRIDAAREQQVWSLCQSAKTPAVCQAYLSEFPNGPHSGQARGKLSDLSGLEALAAPSRPAVAGTIDASGKDDAAMLAAVDEGFSQWSRQWSYDHYIGGSAKLQQRRCGGAACQLGGSIEFRRMSQVMTIPYTGNVARQPGGKIVVSRLCYNDPSSGMSDCTEF